MVKSEFAKFLAHDENGLLDIEETCNKFRRELNAWAHHSAAIDGQRSKIADSVRKVLGKGRMTREELVHSVLHDLQVKSEQFLSMSKEIGLYLDKHTGVHDNTAAVFHSRKGPRGGIAFWTPELRAEVETKTDKKNGGSKRRSSPPAADSSPE